MSRMTTTLDEQGRLIIPAEVRRSLGLKPGDQVVLELDERGVRLLLSRAEALRRAQELVRKYIPEGRSLSDELLEDRRREALSE
ncbi:MAG TPA: AbrB/MazE/SpoVT family DNA-binding domain-containing protein [Thermoanaerobaculia bacterium]|nr:AbrB/MazE/SpoVT family DNA-binding domain-containing protein [Thermoanaerobaculia bacterium]